jgi:two-component system, cell cycle response regulator
VPPPPDQQDVPQIAYDEDADDPDSSTTALHDFASRPTTADRARPAIVIVAGSATGRIYPLRAPVTILGRSLTCDVVIEDAGVSREHARIIVSPHKVRIEDLGSSNGLVYQGQRIRLVSIQDGDRIEIGEAAITILHMDEAATGGAPPSSIAHGRSEAESDASDAKRLLSRTRFLETLRSEYAFTLKHRSPLSVMIFSIDHLPSLLDQHGAEIESMVVQRIVQIIRDSLDRPDAKIGRVAHDRIALLVPELTTPRAIELGLAICTTAATAHLHHKGQTANICLSAGAASLDPLQVPPMPLAELLEEAELNMHLAIVGGRGRCVG